MIIIINKSFFNYINADGGDVRLDEKCTPGETPEPINTCGLASARPLGLGVAVLPPLPPTIAEQRNLSTGSPTFLPSTVVAANKRIPVVPTIPPPRPPRQLDQEVSIITLLLLQMLYKCSPRSFLNINAHQGGKLYDMYSCRMR